MESAISEGFSQRRIVGSAPSRLWAVAQQIEGAARVTMHGGNEHARGALNLRASNQSISNRAADNRRSKVTATKEARGCKWVRQV